MFYKFCLFLFGLSQSFHKNFLSLFFRQSFIVSDSESNSDDSSNCEYSSNESSNAESDKKVSKPGRNSKRSKGKYKDTSSDTDKGRYSF